MKSKLVTVPYKTQRQQNWHPIKIVIIKYSAKIEICNATAKTFSYKKTKIVRKGSIMLAQVCCAL